MDSFEYLIKKQFTIMVAVFYPVGNPEDDALDRIDCDKRTCYLDSKEILEVILKHTNYRRFFDMNSEFGNQVFGGRFDFQQAYNTEELDGGYWCAMLNLTADEVIAILEENECA